MYDFTITFDWHKEKYPPESKNFPDKIDYWTPPADFANDPD